MMQSIFGPAARRDTRREQANLDRRDGELKMDWTKPPGGGGTLALWCIDQNRVEMFYRL
jgi:hypothetical protein